MVPISVRSSQELRAHGQKGREGQRDTGTIGQGPVTHNPSARHRMPGQRPALSQLWEQQPIASSPAHFLAPTLHCGIPLTLSPIMHCGSPYTPKPPFCTMEIPLLIPILNCGVPLTLYSILWDPLAPGPHYAPWSPRILLNSHFVLWGPSSPLTPTLHCGSPYPWPPILNWGSPLPLAHIMHCGVPHS